jgi:ferrous iron transport protein B
MASCHIETPSPLTALHCIALVGHPNVGKSVIFGHLTGRYVTVSNYPGTTVAISRGAARSWPETTVIDTPGVMTLIPRSEDEEATARALLDEALTGIVQVGNATNPRRTLLLTLQLAEMGIPMVLALNMVDEAQLRGVVVNCAHLSTLLGVTVVPTVAPRGEGIDLLAEAISTARVPKFHLAYPAEVEAVLERMLPYLPAAQVSARALGLLFLSGSTVGETWLAMRVDRPTLDHLQAERERLEQILGGKPGLAIQQARIDYVQQVLPGTVGLTQPTSRGFGVLFGRLAMHPIWGMPILAAVLYAIYWFVGIFGAGILVGWLEEVLFGQYLNPTVTALIERLQIPIIGSLLVGDYGLWTMGVTYAVALLLPIVTTFFLAFGILEDSGYLPRLAALSNHLFARIGLNGKAVLPMVLGLGCVTMATMTTRVLEKPRDRLLVTLLLALAVPCSAQLGVVLGLLAAISLHATLIWAGVIFIVLIVTGWLAARALPGERSPLLIELPPIRRPRPGNVLLKTLAQLEWYVREALPLFLLGTLLLWLLDSTGALPWIVRMGEPLVVGWLGLPAQASEAFLMGFLRRDFAATGLFALQSQGLLSPRQTLVAMVTITLFLPCVASVLMIARECGTRTAAGMAALIFPLAFLIGGLLDRALGLLGW